MTSQNTATTSTIVAVEVDPGTLIVGANVRLDARLDSALIDSIRERGVLEPIVAYRDDEGRLVVLMGQRRTLASIQAERKSVPVVVVPKPDEDARLIDQMAENDHRAALTAGERVEAFAQLAAFGLSAGQIAKKAATKREDVDAALAAAKSATARAAIDQTPALTLIQAATVAEFEDDEAAVARLLAAAARGQFEHVAQQVRDERAEAHARAAALDEQTARGITVVDCPFRSDETTKRLTELKDAEGNDLDPTEHETCPGHAVYLAHVRTAVAAFNNDECTCDAEDDDECTCDTEDDDAQDEQPGPQFKAVAVCQGWRAHGHAERYSYGTTRQRAADMTDTERDEAARQRRQTIANNKAADSAQVVRRAWLANLATRKTAPKGGPVFVAEVVTRWPSWVEAHKATTVLGAIFGTEAHQATDHLAALVAKASDARATHLALVRVLAAVEATIERDSWKWANDLRAHYLTTIAGWGYDLAPIERVMAGLDPDEDQPTDEAQQD